MKSTRVLKGFHERQCLTTPYFHLKVEKDIKISAKSMIALFEFYNCEVQTHLREEIRGYGFTLTLDCHTKKEWRYPVCLLSNKNSTGKENPPSMFIK